MDAVMSEKYDCTIIIPNWNGSDLLKENLPSVISAAKFYDPMTKIIVVDDGSTDDSIPILKQNFPSVLILKHDINKGFAKACLSGVLSASSPIIYLLNSDVQVDINFLKPLMRHFEMDDVFAVHSQSFYSANSAPRSIIKIPYFKRGKLRFVKSRLTLNQYGNKNSWYYSFYATGGHVAMRRNIFLELGGFDELFYPFYWEDQDLSYRAWKRGWKTISEPESIVYHRHVGTIRNSYSNWSIKAIRNRNHYLFIWKNITDFKIFYVIHIPWLILRFVYSILIFDFSFYASFFGALGKIKEVLKARKAESKNQKRSDKEIFEFFNQLYS